VLNLKNILKELDWDTQVDAYAPAGIGVKLRMY
jgi:hypothetical protein